MPDNDRRDPVEQIDRLRADTITIIAQLYRDLARRDEAVRTALAEQGKQLTDLRILLASVHEAQGRLVDIVLALHQFVTGEDEPPPRLIGNKRGRGIARALAASPKDRPLDPH